MARVTAAATADRVTRPAHYPALDGLRGVAVLMVACGHAGYSGWLPLVVGCASTGVILFFFLSGFLMGSLYVPDASLSAISRGSLRYWLMFLLRRYVRVYPAFFFAPFVGYLLLLPGAPPDVAHAGSSGLSSLAGALKVALLQHNLGIYWTIKVELFFYRLYPFVIVAFILLGRRLWTLVAFLVWLALLNHFRHGVSGISWNVPVFSASGGYVAIFVAGMLAAMTAERVARRFTLSGKQWDFVAAVSLAAFFLSVLILAQFKPTQTESWQKEWLFAPILFALFVAVLHADGWVVRVLASGPARLLGRVSYSLYLTHIIAFTLVLRWLPAPFQGALTGALAVLVLTALYYCAIERPFVRLSRKIIVTGAGAAESGFGASLTHTTPAVGPAG